MGKFFQEQIKIFHLQEVLVMREDIKNEPKKLVINFHSQIDLNILLHIYENEKMTELFEH
jgi:hypothetical protein